MSRDRMSPQGWGDADGLYQAHHRQDDARSFSSQRSDRSGFQIRAAAHLMNGETHFPTAMSYVSDAQRSDVATVCSGSFMEDIEIESVLSHEDHHHSTHSHNFHSSPASTEKSCSGMTSKRSGAGRVVEFATAPTLQNEAGRKKVASALISLTPNGISERTSSPYLHDMGPPLNRTLLLQKGDGTSSKPGSVKSFGSHTGSDGIGNSHFDDYSGSLDAEAHSVHDEDNQIGASESIVQPLERPKLLSAKESTCSQASSVKSCESQAGSDAGATDDCGGSLDVETHSIETRSVHSQEEAPHIEPIAEQTRVSEMDEPCSKANQMADDDEYLQNGRRSPGGTIYKGRGVRRYQGRYMNLPLMRFHNNGVDLEYTTEDKGSESRQQHSHQEHEEHTNGFNNKYDLRRTTRPPSRKEAHTHSRRSRSRSRSRSPQQKGEGRRACYQQSKGNGGVSRGDER